MTTHVIALTRDSENSDPKNEVIEFTKIAREDEIEIKLGQRVVRIKVCDFEETATALGYIRRQ
jgi:hypothetical protein